MKIPSVFIPSREMKNLIVFSRDALSVRLGHTWNKWYSDFLVPKMLRNSRCEISPVTSELRVNDDPSHAENETTKSSKMYLMYVRSHGI